jgi:hypothetical protein
MSLLVRVRSGAGGAVAVVAFGSAAADCGTAFRLGDPATLRSAWLSMLANRVAHEERGVEAQGMLLEVRSGARLS